MENRQNNIKQNLNKLWNKIRKTLKNYNVCNVLDKNKEEVECKKW